ncbi:MAG: CotH kinase family protein [Rhodoluna sp.]|nr:CotH kinase family protein [Rhodoluna sp.]
MKLKGALLVALLLLVGLTGIPAQAKPNAQDFYSSNTVSQITISVSQKNVAKLATKPKDSVSAKFSIENAGAGFKFSNLPVRFNLKGTSTLRQNPSLLNNRPSMRVKFKRSGPLNIGFLGTLSSLTLNSMTQDPSKIHEYSSYKLFNAMNVPAPRVTYAQVTLIVDGKSYQKGLFAIIEPYDDQFLKQRFTTRTTHVYEPCNHWTDITNAGAAKGGEKCDTAVFEVKEGWKKTPNKDDLRSLVNVQKIADDKQWWTAMDRFTDRDEFIRMWAVENFTMAWDSYSGSIVNNYYLRSDQLGVFTMHPTGADESFSYNFKMDAPSIGYPLIYYDFQVQVKGRGSMFSRCLRFKPCFNQYLDELKATKDTAKKIDLAGQMGAIAAQIKAPSLGAVSAAQNWIGVKSSEVDALLAKYGR